MITEIESTQPKNVLDIRWALSNVCNYKCSYCFQGSNEGNFKFPADVSLVVANFNQIFDYYKKHLGKTKFHLRLLGGEPTLWPDLGSFINSIKQKNDVYVSLITNGSRSLDWWQKNSDLIDNITLSYHRSFANLPHVMRVADLLYSLNKKITVHVLMNPHDWKACVEDIKYMKRESKHSWLIQTKKIIPTSKFYPIYSKEQNKFMSSEIKRFPSFLWLIQHFKLILNKTIRLYESKYVKQDKTFKARSETYLVNHDIKFKGYECNMGIESLYINWDGLLSASCGQSLFDNKYNILKEMEFFPPLRPVICQQENCFCPTENHVSKKFIPITSA
jgi:MoaA/NifB/PqqE/SkfB family radical SAM enzyme